MSNPTPHRNSDNRLPVAIGHVSFRVNKVAESTDFLVKLGLRSIHESDEFAVLELRGGTHLVLGLAEESIAPGTTAPFDLMVDDLAAARKTMAMRGCNPPQSKKVRSTIGSPSSTPVGMS